MRLTVSGPGGSDTVTLQDAIAVSPSPLAEVHLSQAEIKLQVQDTERLEARALDRFGNEIANVKFFWSTQGPQGNMDATGRFSAGTEAGRYDALVKVTATQGELRQVAFTDVTIAPGPLSVLMVEPSEIILEIGASETFTFIALDAYQNKITDALATWRVLPGVGTIDANGVLTAGTSPGTRKDAIQVTVTQGDITRLATASISVKGTIVDSQILTQDTIWTFSESPFLVRWSVRVDEGATLTIEPGVQIRFVSHAKLQVLGKLTAVGTKDLPIKFAPLSDTWAGIQFWGPRSDYSNDNGSIIERANIQGEQVPILIAAASPKIIYNEIEGRVQVIFGTPMIVGNRIGFGLGRGNRALEIVFDQGALEDFANGDRLTDDVARWQYTLQSSMIIADNVISQDVAFFCSPSTAHTLIDFSRNKVTGTGDSGALLVLNGCRNASITYSSFVGAQYRGILVNLESDGELQTPSDEVSLSIQRNTIEGNGTGLFIQTVLTGHWQSRRIISPTIRVTLWNFTTWIAQSSYR